MKAAYINRVGSPDEIVFGELPEPGVSREQVLVSVAAVTVDPIDTYIRSGTYKLELPFPFIVGRDMVGVVEAVGTGVRGFQSGDRVWCNNQGYDGRQGTFAERIAIDQKLLYKIPDGVEQINLLCSAHSALTVVLGLIRKAQLKAGESLFINGGSGNVGNLAIQLAKYIGARCATTAGSEEKKQWCVDSGADHVIDYKQQRIENELPKFAPDGVDVYWDLTKAPDVNRAVALTARRGRILLSSGITHTSELNIGAFYTHNLSMFGFTITDLDDSELAHWAGILNELFAKGVFKSRVAKRMALKDAAEAHRLMEQGSLDGKIVLVVS
jgi:NADPH2:quinone reductase